MTKKEILSHIRKHCKQCPLRCDGQCDLTPLKDGVDTTKKPRAMSEKVLMNLKGYQRKMEVMA